MVFALEPESTESLQATLAFIDETLGDSTPANSPDSNAQLHSPSSEDWETSHLLDDFMTDESSPRVAADLALVAEQPMHFQSLRVIGNALFAPEAPKMSSLGLSVAISTTIETLAQSPSRKKRRNYNPNKARQELQRELTYLRGEAHELEAKLQQLQTLKVAKTKDRSTPSQLAATRQTRTGYGSFVWEDTCHRQLECRLRSERENAYLKSLLDGQVQAARSLEKLLSKRAALHATETSGSKRTTRVHVSRTGSEIVEKKVFEELADGVEASYREAESVFVSSGLELSNVSSRKVQMRAATTVCFWRSLIARCCHSICSLQAKHGGADGIISIQTEGAVTLWRVQRTRLLSTLAWK
ncbi:unnamed protein product [Phytophthora lilii]|uniref:Unnamed protein product n=1 Tax=Phytophthora lilii TaxID=2077276 RepID=A0A9W6X0K6_9STRA|nr:unnamed protein product [Phytophthora lilii]